MTNHSTHFFLAVPLSPSVRTSLQNEINSMKEQQHFKTWVHPEDFHITLAFLGNAPIEKLELLKNNLTPIVARHSTFELILSDWGFFGQKEAPRIFWRGIQHSESLFNLQKDVYQACVDYGFELDKKPFKPHITVARRWKSEENFSQEILQNKKGETENQKWEVSETCLFQTHMKRSPKYETIKAFSLK